MHLLPRPRQGDRRRRARRSATDDQSGQARLHASPSKRNPSAASPGPKASATPCPAPPIMSRRMNIRVEEDMRSEEHTSELQFIMTHAYDVFCLEKQTNKHTNHK